jgi:arginine utilization regulatory protein
VQYFIKRFLAKYSKSQDLIFNEHVFQYLQEMEFPGNVRELESLIYKILSQTSSKNEEIKLTDIQPILLQPPREYRNIPEHFILKDFLSNIQYETIRDALHHNKRNISKTASTLGMSRQNLQYLIKKYGLRSH